MRGEYRLFGEEYRSTAGSPPLARGILPSKIPASSMIRITPACAGNTLKMDLIFSISRDHPRLRGEYSGLFFQFLEEAGSPPLARGIRYGYIPEEVRSGITPACAGNTPLDNARCRWTRDHPRLRGEYLC